MEYEAYKVRGFGLKKEITGVLALSGGRHGNAAG